MPTGGPPQATGRPVSVYERPIVEGNHISRCLRLWTNLRGASSDFDDLSFAVAETLGFARVPSPESFSADLNAADDFINRQPWRKVRQSAVDTFFERYDTPESDCYEPDRLDWRTWDQRVADAQFLNGRCRWCQLGIGGGSTAHAEISGVVASGRRTVDDIERAAAALTSAD